MKAIEWYKVGWQVFAANPLKTILGCVVVLGVIVVQSFFLPLIWNALGLNDPISLTILFVVSFSIGASVGVGLSLFFLRIVRGERPSPLDVFNGFSFYLNATIAGFIAILLGIVGYVLFIIPGVIISIIFSMWAFGVGDKRLSAIESLKFSVRITRGRRMDLFLGGLIFVLLCGLASIPFGLGLIVVAPWGLATFSIAYEDLAGGSVAQSAIVE